MYVFDVTSIEREREREREERERERREGGVRQSKAHLRLFLSLFFVIVFNLFTTVSVEP